MRTEAEIKSKIAEIETDSRYQSGLERPATIAENAPLALIQLTLETQIATLNWVLQEKKK